MNKDDPEFEEAVTAPVRKCACLGHYFPGVEHIAPCCSTPHITEEEYFGRDNVSLGEN